MNGEQFDLVQRLVEKCSSRDARDAARFFRAALEKLGFRYFACCSHVDPLAPPEGAVVLHSYPMEWVRTFSERRLAHCDPVLRHAAHTPLPFFWDAPEFRSPLTRGDKAILSEASRFGLVHGFTIPIHIPGALPASCSVVPESSSLHMSSYFAAQLMACYMYVAAARRLNAQRPLQSPRLSARERECLELAAHGKSDWAAGMLLGISERTVHNHIESAKRRLGVATRVQAIVRALTTGQISLGDVVRADRDA